MNRLTTWRGFIEPTRDKQRAAPINLGAFVKRSIKTKTPVTHSFGRGYGFRNIKPLGTALLPEREELQRREMALNRVKVKQEKEGDEVGTTKKSEKESLNDIITDLVSLTDKEIQTILDRDSTSPDVEQGKTWLEESQFALGPVPDDKEKLMLTKQSGNTKVTVLFRRDYEENEEEEEEEGGEEIQETEEGANEEEVIKNEGNENTEDWVRSGDELPDREDMPEKHSLDIRIEISDNEGKPKGILRFNAFAGMDDRLYVEEMICENASDEKVMNTEDQPVIVFDDLSDTMQDRIYDYLDELGVDDKLAHFVKTSVAREKKEADVAFLNKFKEILKV